MGALTQISTCHISYGQQNQNSSHTPSIYIVQYNDDMTYRVDKIPPHWYVSVLPVPLTSAPNERVFSWACLWWQCSLQEYNAWELCFLNHHWKSWHFNDEIIIWKIDFRVFLQLRAVHNFCELVLYALHCLLTVVWVMQKYRHHQWKLENIGIGPKK